MESDSPEVPFYEDPVLNRLDPPLLHIKSTENVFHDLMSCIIEQQIHYRSTKGFFQKPLDQAGITELNLTNVQAFTASLSTIKLSQRKQETVAHTLAFFLENQIDWQSLPDELLNVGERTGLDGNILARSSKLSAKVDNTAIQDGYQLYIHSFIVSVDGSWTVIQQGMNPSDKSARRYHWHSEEVTSFVQDPHAAICGENQGEILNLTDSRAQPAQRSILEVSKEKVPALLREMSLPSYKGVRTSDVDLKRLGAVLQLAQDAPVADFESLLLLKGVGPRTLRSLALVSEVIHGTPIRFTDPARFAFAHGGKGGNPAPVPTHVYDEVIHIMKDAVSRAKVQQTDKQQAIKSLDKLARRLENGYTPKPFLHDFMEEEQKEAWKYGGRTARGFSKPPNDQLNLFD